MLKKRDKENRIRLKKMRWVFADRAVNSSQYCELSSCDCLSQFIPWYHLPTCLTKPQGQFAFQWLDFWTNEQRQNQLSISSSLEMKSVYLNVFHIEALKLRFEYYKFPKSQHWIQIQSLTRWKYLKPLTCAHRWKMIFILIVHKCWLAWRCAKSDPFCQSVTQVLHSICENW